MIFEKKRIYIVVKTYPIISEEYSELVCTAGILEDGSWVRLYPIPFRKLDLDQKYPKYTWIEADICRNTADFRPESYRPNLDTLVVEPKPKVKVNWEKRREIILDNAKVYTNLQELIDKAKSDSTSLAVFKPAKIIDFIAKETARDWNPDKLEKLKKNAEQYKLFQTPEEVEAEFKLVQKIPYTFSYEFEDEVGKKANLMVEDWETGMLFLNCLKAAKGDEKIAIAKVKEKYYDDFALERDLYFFLGTTKEWHNVAPNPFIIIGVFAPPMPSGQLSLF